jgi:excinuclease ABC subunit A
MGGAGHITLRGVAVHNLQAVDLDIPRQQLVVLCGVSGSGKSSLALDTLYAEGQRRYIESFSAYTRQFLQRLEKPQAERIDGIPPAIAVTGRNASRSSRSTVGTATETADYLRLLFAKIGHVFCLRCGQEVRADTAESTAASLAALPGGTRFLVAFAAAIPGAGGLPAAAAALREEGFVRMLAGSGKEYSLWNVDQPPPGSECKAPSTGCPAGGSPCDEVYSVVDRLAAGGATPQRVRESLETAYSKGQGTCFVFIEEGLGPSALGLRGTSKTQAPSPPGTRLRVPLPPTTSWCPERGVLLEPLSSQVPALDPKTQDPRPKTQDQLPGAACRIDGRPWRRLAQSGQLACADCGIEYPVPEPRLYSFNSPLGACPECEGFGNVIGVDMDLVVPDPRKSIREGAIAPWNTPAYAHELEELLGLAGDFGVPVDAPFSQLTEAQRNVVLHGVPERKFGGLDGFFAWLERRKYKMHIRVFLSRWRSYRPCPACGGTRLRPEALAARIGGRNIAEISALKVAEAAAFFRRLELPPWERTVGHTMLDEVQARLGYLEAVGLGYLTLDRTIRTTSGGEARRVVLTSALGSSLVHMLYVLDEPSIGLHPRDIARLVAAVRKLRDRGNTVVVVEHEESMIRAADQVIEIGPGAGQRGGRVVFQGTPAAMQECPDSLTGDYLAGRRGRGAAAHRREPNHGWIRLAGARGNNLRGVTVEFPLGVLCLVTGVSGSGKSTLIEETLYPALCRRLRKDAPKPLAYDDVFGDGQIDDVIMVDQSPIGRSPRSNPVTYLKVFDEIRNVFADTLEARTRNFDAGQFSFNVDGGRCSACEGQGFLQIDMQFLADVYMRCPQCNGARYRDEILDVTYRGRNIAEVLEMTVREAFTFFRGQPKVQARLKRLIDVGLDYVRLGQPANTLSGGESQRLKLAGHMSAGHRAAAGSGGSPSRRGRTLFILDEPTTGLHFSDIVQLLDCFDALLAVGHSLIVVEHNLQLMKAADYIVDLGPGAADEGGRVVAKGTPEMVARTRGSATAEFLAKVLEEPAEEEE